MSISTFLSCRQAASLNKSKFNGVAFLDLKKAFDLIDHQILVKEEEEEDDVDDDDGGEEEEEEEDVSIKQQCRSDLKLFNIFVLTVTHSFKS